MNPSSMLFDAHQGRNRGGSSSTTATTQNQSNTGVGTNNNNNTGGGGGTNPSGLPGLMMAEEARLAFINSLAAVDPHTQNLLLNHHRNLAFTTHDAAQRSVMQVLARHNNHDGSTPSCGFDGTDDEIIQAKRKQHALDSLVVPTNDANNNIISDNTESNNHLDGNCAANNDQEPKTKKQRLTRSLSPGGNSLDNKNLQDGDIGDDGSAPSQSVLMGSGETTTTISINGPEPVAPSLEGLAYFSDCDVLSGRGGGTNVHPGNRHFRDLINLHRRAYLKARKNDKPAISRAIVRTIRENNGKFLKRDEKTGLWFEIGDDAAREKTSQALRQRAPEMRKILFESEREQARQEAEEQLRQHQQLLVSGLANATPGDLMGGGGGATSNHHPLMNHPGMGYPAAVNPHPMLNPLLAQMQQQLNKHQQSLSAAAASGGNGSAPSSGPQGSQQPQQHQQQSQEQQQQQSAPADPYSQVSQNLMAAALLGGGVNRFATNGAA